MIRKAVSSLVSFIIWGLPLMQGGCGSCVKPDERVIFFPTDGYLSEDTETWSVPVHGWIFEPEEDCVWRRAVIKRLDDWLETDPADHENPIFRSRVRMFLVDNERGKKLRIDLDGKQSVMGISRENGHFRGMVHLAAGRRLGNGDDRRTVDLSTTPCRRGGRVDSGRAQLVPPTGISVISDIDDTIKVTEVLDKKALLANTFLEPFRPVSGMPERFAAWASQGAVFHYVSASPWQLYPALSGFIEASGLPNGSFHLKDFRLFDQTFFNLFRSSESYKVPILESILSTFPSRKFILVGDSGEKDPEVYGIVARRYPKRILHIYIRNVMSGEEEPQRYTKAFQGVSVERWTIFDEAGELPERLPGNEEQGKPLTIVKTGSVP